MARDPKDRYQVAGALRDDLDRFLTHQSILAKPPSLGGRAWRWIRRNERVLGAAAAALVALVVGVNWQSMRAQAQALKPHLEAMAFGIQAGSLAELPPQQQFEIQAHLEALRERRDDLDAEQLSQVQTLEHKFESLRAELVQRGKNQLTTSRDPAQSDGAQQSSRLAAMQTLQHAALLFPRDTELKRLATLESAYPRVSVKAIDAAGQPIAASVAARVINDSSCAIGPPVALGRTPLDAIPLLPGTVRVIVAFDSGGSREMICFPGSQAQDIELVAVRRTDEESITRDMIAIPGGPFSIGGFGGEYRFPDSTLELEPYWIDSTEVSNAAYARFLEATGRQAPVMWKNAVDRAEFLAEHGQLPVSGVSWLDAVAYAEWAGKRLPTLAEWLCAAEGREHRPWPYAAEVGAPARGNVLQPLEPFGEDFENWEQYLRRTTTVESYPEARTPEGLFHLYGNVAEWTESTGVSLDPSGRPAVLSQARWYLGGWWEAATRRAPLRHPAYGGVGPKELSHTLGFRCAKSAGPR